MQDPTTSEPSADGLRRADSVTVFSNARWLVGDTFVAGERRVSEGRIVEDRGQPVARTIDLGGAYVLPAFGDAHTHNLDGDTSTLAEYRREGVAYVQVLTNTPEGRARVAAALEGPGTIDASYANGGVTATYGHPMIAYEPRAMGLDWTAFRERRADICASRIMDRRAYWFVDTVEDLDRQWPDILAGDPHVVKIFLLDAAAHPGTPTCDDLGRIGLLPEIAREVTRRAHGEGLQVWAHVETADDFALAVDIGVDGVAHMPGYAFRTSNPNETAERFRIDPDAARRAGEAGVFVTPTLSIITAYAEQDTALVARARALQRENLVLLEEHGVPIVVGSDWYGRTAGGEVEALASFDLWSPTELMLAWSRTTPRAIFPGRKVGALDAGSEATFVTFLCDPRERVECLREIEMRVTDGRILASDPSAGAPSEGAAADPPPPD